MKNRLEDCEAQCDQDYDLNRANCEWNWMMHGRNATIYQQCMSRARAIQVACFQECMKEFEDGQ
jgi:hypothetical protein